ncbi:MAG: DUF4288 domain-containing protein [Ferruginibacter sp.]|nr:DUF4288 domain-containing protein [Ferruginibacter sp.]
MNWFIAKLVYQVTCGAGDHTPQFDEQIRMIQADDHLHAFHKARLIGDAEGRHPASISKANVVWRFIDVIDLVPIILNMDGAEINSRVYEEEDAEMYIRTAQRKARQLLQTGLHQFTSTN